MQIHSKFLSTLMVCAGMVVLSSCGGSGGSVSPEPTPAPSYEIGGTVSGLYSAQSTVTLKNSTDTVTVTGNGSFVFSKKVSGLGDYDVTIARQPHNPPQNCTVSNGSGVAMGEVSSVQVNCTAPAEFSIGGTVTGLAGADGGLVLVDNTQPNDADQLAVNGNGSFTFADPVVMTEKFSVTVAAQPTHPIQNCAVTNGSGTVAADVKTVTVVCAPATKFTIGGTVENLTGTASGLVLQNNFANVAITGDGSFAFSGTVDAGDGYDVTIVQQPFNPAQTCSVANGHGMAMAEVTNVLINCGHKEWAWMAGSTANGQDGVYGTMGVPAAQNSPGSRQLPAAWVDSEGNFWMFGGYGYDSVGTLEPLNDMWKFSNGEWAWLGGPNRAGGSGVYGTLGVANASNIPGARYEAAYWKDANGDVWLFGGEGFDSNGSENSLNDLWKFSNGEWTWMGGSKVAVASGVYGTLGVAGTSNIPGARFEAMHWVDASGNLWLFGGLGYDSTGAQGLLNDLWKYSNGEWAWISGSNVVNQNSVYGTQGVASATNVPGSRYAGYAWADNAGDFWLFAGAGYPASGSSIVLGDFWKFINGEWTCVSGLGGSQTPAYGTQGVTDPNNHPGSRQMGISWTDASGNLWLFGGNGQGGNGGNAGELNDLWEYSNGEWTWVSGWQTIDTVGVFGTEGVFAPTNIPGGRTDGVTWVDANDNLWLFGGYGYGAPSAPGNLNDMWEYMF